METQFQYTSPNASTPITNKIRCIVLYANPKLGRQLANRIQSIQSNWALYTLPSEQMSWEEEITLLKPHLVFFQIGAEVNLSLRLLNQIRMNQNFFHLALISTGDYSSQALELGTMGYLKEGFNDNELRLILTRTQLSLVKEETNQTNTPTTIPKRIMIQTHDGFNLIDIEKISYLKAEGCYTTIHLDDKEILVTRRLKEYDMLLSTGLFFRPHRSYIVNISSINSYVKSDGGYLQMSDGEIVSLSRSKKNEFIKLFLS